jgi:hypothetical protein
MILDRPTIQNLLNYSLDVNTYPDLYLNTVIAAVEGDIERYLGWNPTLHYWQNEEGTAQYVQGGPYAGRYLLEMRNQPLVPGDATAIFTSLQLRYAMTPPTGTSVTLSYATVMHDTAQVFCLGPGAVEAMFAFAPSLQAVSAVGYTASYCAGYAVNNGTDPINPVTSLPFTNVSPLPTQIQQAAALLVREKLIFGAALNKSWDSPAAGFVTRRRVGEREEAYQVPTQSTASRTLGFGTSLSGSAAQLLKPYIRRQEPLFV